MAVDKIASALQAANAYANTAGASNKPGVAGGDGAYFSNMLKTAVKDSIDTIRAGEKASADAVMGTASLTDVVEAVNAAEMTLQTVVAVRDRMIQAYQEIMRLPI